MLLAENTAKQEYATFATQCLEACTLNLEDSKQDINVSSQFNICANIFMNYLTNDKNFTELLHCKVSQNLYFYCTLLIYVF